MKIFYLANIRLPSEKAHGVHYVKMAEALANLGHEVKLMVAGRYNPNFKNTNPFEFYAVKKNFTLKQLWVIDILNWLSKARVATWLLNLTFTLSSFFYVLFNKCDLIYSRDALPLFFLSLFKKNFIFELHEYRAKDKWLYHWLQKRGRGIVVITHYLKDLLVRDGLKGEKILLAPDGVDLKIFNFQSFDKLRTSFSIFNLRQKLNIPPNKKIIMYTGSLYRWKGVYTLVQITRYPLQACPEQSRGVTHYLIVLVGGMDYDIERLKNFIKENNLPADKILILGHKPYREIPHYLAAADVLVLPNSAQKEISARFTSPLKMFEYMAARKPIVATDLPSIHEVLNENNAILVQPDDPENLALGINKALTDQNLVSKITKQAYQDVQRYTWQKRVVKIINFVS